MGIASQKVKQHTQGDGGWVRRAQPTRPPATPPTLKALVGPEAYPVLSKPPRPDRVGQGGRGTRASRPPWSVRGKDERTKGKEPEEDKHVCWGGASYRHGRGVWDRTNVKHERRAYFVLGDPPSYSTMAVPVLCSLLKGGSSPEPDTEGAQRPGCPGITQAPSGGTRPGGSPKV